MSTAKRKPPRDLEHHRAVHERFRWSLTENPLKVYHGVSPFVKRRFSV